MGDGRWEMGEVRSERNNEAVRRLLSVLSANTLSSIFIGDPVMAKGQNAQKTSKKAPKKSMKEKKAAKRESKDAKK